MKIWVIAACLVALAHGTSWGRRPPRFHLATPRLHARLARQARAGQNLEAVAHYRRAGGRTGGTAFVVSAPDEKGVALALTNHHVALYDKKTVKGDALLFHQDGASRPTAAKILGCLASDRQMDYALLSVKLPRKLRGLAPVRISLDGSRGVRQVYNAGFPRIWQAERKRAADKQLSLVAGGRQRPAFQRALRARSLLPKMVQVGRVNNEMWVDPFITLRLANENGSSGSPIFAKRNHRVIGMLCAGGGNVDAFAMPMGEILRGIAKQRPGITDPSMARAVDRLLRGSGSTGP